MERKIKEKFVPALLETAVTAIGLATCDGVTVAGAQVTGSRLAQAVLDETDTPHHDKKE